MKIYLKHNKGNEILPFMYDFITVYEEGYASVLKDDKWGVVNADKEIVIPFVYEIISFENGMLNARKNGK